MTYQLNIDGLKYLKFALTIACIGFLLSSCTANKAIMQDEPNEPFEIEGQWVIVNDTDYKNDIFFDFRQSESSLALTVLGRETKLQNFREQGNQLIFTYKIPGEEPFNVLLTKLANDRVKFSQVNYAINDFHPVGRLGEKVFHMQKVTEGEPAFIASRSSQK